MGLIRREPGYWAKRAKTSRGRAKYLNSPEQLWKLACEYFEYVDSTPVNTKEVLRGGERAGDIVESTVDRPYTWYGLADFLWAKGVISILKDYRTNREGRYDEYVPVITRVSEIIREQKYSGAAVGTFKEGLIIKDLQGELEREKVSENTEDSNITINIIK